MWINLIDDLSHWLGSGGCVAISAQAIGWLWIDSLELYN